jgi:hypothetical protein
LKHKKQSPDEAEAIYEASMRESLLQAFRMSQYGKIRNTTETLFDLFSDMAHNKRWTICIEDVDDAITFAAFLAQQILLLQSDPDRWSPERRARAPLILKIVNQWLKPSRPLYGLPLVNHFARALFGDVWGDLVLTDTVQEWDIHKIITASRPAFQAHMVPHKVDLAIDLPSLDIT